uniref:Uncharacterized protein n=1 Tax=Cacopsylla melanoneura TaxID=428564 RepID=A0A8D8VKZ5_9HEMI
MKRTACCIRQTRSLRPCPPWGRVWRGLGSNTAIPRTSPPFLSRLKSQRRSYKMVAPPFPTCLPCCHLPPWRAAKVSSNGKVLSFHRMSQKSTWIRSNLPWPSLSALTEMNKL